MIKITDYTFSQEFSQAKIRLVIISLIFIIFYMGSYSPESIFISGSYFVYSLVSIYTMIKQQKSSPMRIVLNMIGDIATISFAVYYNSSNPIIMYPMLLWIIIGNGMRFGVKSIFVSLAVSEVGFATVLMSNDYMILHKEAMYALLFGLIAVSMFYVILVKKLHDANDVLEEKVSQRVAEVKHIYLHDSLTGLKNRMALVDDLRESTTSGLILIDVDNFHNYNELYGMEVGNKVLQEVSLYIQSSTLGEKYDLYRIYGDHFVLRGKYRDIKRHIIESDIKEIVSLFKNFKINIENLNDALDIDITIGASLGKENTLKMLEMALKHAKKTKKTYSIYTKNIDNTNYSQELLVWKNKIKKAIISDNIVPVYQSIVDKNNTIVKYESLMRLRELSDDKEVLISPFYFLDIAIKSKIYPQLTHIMIEKTFKDMKENGHDFSINLTFEDMINSDIVTTLKTKIEKYDIAKQIIFEIVESENIDDFPYAKKFVQEFKAMGVRIAIDDFGTGYSNFTHIFELEPDFLKIDGSLIKNIDNDKKSYELVASIVYFSQSLGIQTIAEFVSSKEIFKICENLGIDQFQGYYFSEPLIYNKLRTYEFENKMDNKTTSIV
jgi:diguanylate cyclase (GGDEF)-like protein